MDYLNISSEEYTPNISTDQMIFECIIKRINIINNNSNEYPKERILIELSKYFIFLCKYSIEEIISNCLDFLKISFDWWKDFIYFNDNNGFSPIFYLLSNINVTITIIKKFQDCSNCLDVINKYDGSTPLLIAVTFPHTTLDIIKLLVENSASINVENNLKNNIFHFISENSNCKDIQNILEYLYDKSNKLNSVNINNMTPLFYAAYHNKLSIVDFCLKKKCDSNICNLNENTPLMYACMHNNYEMIKLFLDNGAEINKADKQGDIPFMYICGCDNKGTLDLNCIKYMVFRGADIHKVSKDKYYTPLMYACCCTTSFGYHPLFKPNVKIIKYLINIGIDTTKKSIDNKDFVSYLIDRIKMNNYNQLDELINKKYIKINNESILQYIYLTNNKRYKKYLYDNQIIKEIVPKYEECNICKCDLIKGNEILLCSNNHNYHKNCIISWFKTCKNTKCPLCMTYFNFTFDKLLVL